MATLVINTSRVPQQVGIILADGSKSSVRLMGRGRGHLGAGERVDPNWMALNGASIKTVEEDTVPISTAETVIAKENTQ
jgi:hypothetical protein